MRRISCDALHCPEHVAILEDNGGLLIRLLTDLTIKNADAVHRAVLTAWEELGRPARIVLDLSGVRHLDSSGVGALMDLSRRAGALQIPCVLCVLQGAPRKLLERTGLIELFDVASTIGAAHRLRHPFMESSL